MTEKNVFADGFIEVKGARENNLKNLTVKIPKYQTTVFVGLSGAGKSSLVFDTIAAMSRRELNETFASFTQQYLPKYGQPHVDQINHLPVAIVIEQRKIGENARSTVGTYTGAYSLLRLLFSRIGQPFIGYSDSFSFNMPKGMCPHCQGLGYVDDINENLLIDKKQSLNQGAIKFVSFGLNTWRWRRYVNSGLFDNDKAIKDYTDKAWQLLMYAPQQQLKNPGPKFPKTALYEGLIPRIKRSILHKKEAEHHQAEIAKFVSHRECPFCHGSRLNAIVLSNHIAGKNIADLCALNLNDLDVFLAKIFDPLTTDLIRELRTKIHSMVDIGLGYLSLSRGTNSLSGGEAQRIKIAKFLNSSLSDMVYILDEPSVGLHPHDIALLKKGLSRLRDKGNTILIVEHNPLMMAFADYAIELGPVAGANGGQITFQGSFKELSHSKSLTGHWLRRRLTFKDKIRKSSKMIELTNLHMHNLKKIHVKIPLDLLTVLTGVAGSGKSSILQELKKVLTEPYIDLAQKDIGTNLRSTPATYLGILDRIRSLFAKTNQVSSSLFSYNGLGACPVCKGKGVTITNMAFMDPVVQFCESCQGERYSKKALAYNYEGRNIADVLSFSVDQAAKFFSAGPIVDSKLVEQLTSLQRVGLSYLKLNQTLTTLSGGELQRIKLASQLNQKGTIFLLDEPTSGLHMQDIFKQIKLINQLVDAGNGVIVIEHNQAVISQADYLIDVGPGAGMFGGRILYSGLPAGIIDCADSVTGQALKKALAIPQ
ncbi:excinuclease ABC subunit UvrA [Oenococcus sicerae]|uniref:UvrABC system protein A n=1 Tax=Oenococcus sicerae TaxID=2203724 RepID=A0AAJ1R9A7_9LACO|nr:excinuclease ABC subunit UvrA [Oenococcus sicerae]MDN6899615.1 excinuclease ABC subunit UvrA [Oenococcus sicerae]